jgi:hypothetical protein
VLDAVDSMLASAADRIERTRKGRVWDIWVRERPVHVRIEGSPPVVILSAGCNSPEDYAILRRLAADLARAVGGLASEPDK